MPPETLASQQRASPRWVAHGCAIDDEIKALSVIQPHAHSSCIGKPLLRYHPPCRADSLARDLHEASSC